MKKILSTTLVAIAFAMVSTVDAKVMKRNAQPKAMSESASNIVVTSKKVQKGQTSPEAILDTVKNEAQTSAEENTLPLLAKEDMLKKEQEVIKQEIKDNRGGWFDWLTGRTPKDQKEAKKEAMTEAIDNLQKNQADLKKVQADINENKKEVGMSWYNANAFALKVMAVFGLVASVFAYDEYKTHGTTRVRGAYEAGKGYASEAGATYKKYAPKMLGGTETQPTTRPTVRERIYERSTGQYNQ
ncbi:MAG TPA: hypothetical protein VHX42_00280 [Candidatus Babeliales bacterium]|jgi:hypothetical protein|nr:hypothetical protein [Candidatus Babeliales bacterium]